MGPTLTVWEYLTRWTVKWIQFCSLQHESWGTTNLTLPSWKFFVKTLSPRAIIFHSKHVQVYSHCIYAKKYILRHSIRCEWFFSKNLEEFDTFLRTSFPESTFTVFGETTMHNRVVKFQSEGKWKPLCNCRQICAFSVDSGT